MNGRSVFASALATLLITISACSGDADYNDNNIDTAGAGVAGTSVESDTTSDIGAGSDAAVEGPTAIYESRGKVTKIDRENGRIELDHEKIEGWMDAMVMPFPVADPALLDQVVVGKTYTFSVEVRGDNYRITTLAPVP